LYFGGNALKKSLRTPHEPLSYEQLSLNGFRVAKGYYTTVEVAELYHVSQDTVRSWIKREWLSAHRDDVGKRGSNWKIHPQSIEDIDRATDDLLRANRGLIVAAYGRKKAGRH
jgi:excisionase family DNA binding protein